MNNILIICAGRRVNLYRFFIDELIKLKINTKIYCADSNPHLSAAAIYSKNYIKLKKTDEKGFIEDLKNKCLRFNISLIIPTTDNELLLLSNHEKEFKEIDVTIIISNNKFVKNTSNKIKTKSIFDEILLNYPKIYKSKNEIIYPCYAKPITGSSSKNNYIINNDLDYRYAKSKCKDLIFMKYLDEKKFTEYTIDLYYDKLGKLKILVARERIEVRDGEVTKAITNMKISKRLWSNFSKIKEARGPVTAQVFVDNKNYKIYGIEINARFGGGYPLSYYANANFILCILKEYIMNKKIIKNMIWKNKLKMLRYDQEIIC